MTEPTDPVVASKIIQALASYLKRDPATITESHHLRDDLGLDSVAIIELLFEIEERFKLQIPDQDLPGLSTVGSVAAYVQRRLAEPKAESKPATEKAVTVSNKSGTTKSAKTKSAGTKSTANKAKSAAAKSTPIKSAAAKPTSSRKPKVASRVTSRKKKVAAR
jgi:acyl carrier protein